MKGQGLSQHHIRENVALTHNFWSHRKQFSLKSTAGRRLLCCCFWELKSFDWFGRFWAASHHLSKCLPHLTPFSLHRVSQKHSCSDLTAFHPNVEKEDWLIGIVWVFYSCLQIKIYYFCRLFFLPNTFNQIFCTGGKSLMLSPNQT